MTRSFGLTLLILAAAATDAPAQARRVDASGLGLEIPASSHALSPGSAFLYSMVLPGAGQGRLGSERWIPYALVEIWGWMRYLGNLEEGRDFERRYQDLAWSVARYDGAGSRRDGDWEYYEALGRFLESGLFDADPGRPGVQPETDESTYNGSIWTLARAIHLPAGVEDLAEDSPEYRAALAYYGSRAVTQAFAWSWTGKAAQRKAYLELIDSTDEAFRKATRTLGLILANHLVSAVDALVTARLANAGRSPSIELQSTIDLWGDRPRWSAGVNIHWPER